MSVRGRALLALAVLLGAGSSARADTCIAVDTRILGRGPRSPLLLRTMEEEASSIWGRYGVRIVRSADAGADRCARVAGSFDVIVERAARTRRQFTLGPTVLGRTWIDSRSIDRRPIRIDYDATEQLLGLITQERLLIVTRRYAVGSVEIGRALGRVLAHEIGHVLLDERGHQPKGLMRPRFHPEELAGIYRSSFSLSADEVDRLRARERQLEVRAPHAPLPAASEWNGSVRAEPAGVQIR